MSGNSQTTEYSQCSAVAELLSPYLDGEVTLAEKAVVEEHLASCDSCTGELDSLRQTVSLLEALPTLEVPRSFTLQPSARRQMSLFFLLRNATATLAAVLLVLIAGSLYLESAAPQMAAPAAYSRTAASKATELKAEDATAAVQFDAAEGQKPEILASGVPEVAGERALAPAAAAAPAPATQPATAMAPAASPPPAAAERAPLAPPQPAAAPPASREESDAQKKAGSVEGAPAAGTPAPGEAAAERAAPSEEPAPKLAQKAQLEQAPPERDYASGEANANGLQAVARWPLREIQIGVGILLVVCIGATLAVRARSRP